MAANEPFVALLMIVFTTASIGILTWILDQYLLQL